MIAVLDKDDYKKFNESLTILSNEGYEVPHTVEYNKDGTFKIEIFINDEQIEKLDKILLDTGADL
tara:strand:- start:177 stop:371 length:195 start_codon:yes stop_codon:yes gene_type:complete